MKSGVCASIMAVCVLQEMGFQPRGSVLLTCVCDEEVGGRLGTGYLLDRGLIRGDFGINCEATNLRVEIAHKGILRGTVTVRGRAAHGSRPWLGVDAIEKAIRVMGSLYHLRDNLVKRYHPLLGHPTLIIGTVYGGTCPNMVPSRCEFTFDRRLIPGETHHGAEQEIRALMEDLAREDPELHASIEITNRRPILEVPESALIVRVLREAHAECTGSDPGVGGKDAGTDAALIVARTGMAMPIYGPGDYLKGSLAANEYIQIEDVLLATSVYALTISKLLG
jgi:acetylornithine deacetylase